MLAHLPVELLHAIVKTIDDRPTIISVLLTSRYLHTETEPILYQSVRFLEADNSGITSRLQGFSSRITSSNGRLARYVKELTVDLGPVRFPHAAQACLSIILKQLVNLKVFILDYKTIAKDYEVLPIVYDTAVPFSLTRFTWYHSVHQPDLFAAFIGFQTSLEHLDVPLLQLPSPLPPTSLPRLRILQSLITTAALILPGRHITHLRTSFLYEMFDVQPIVKTALTSIRLFSSFGLYEPMIAFASLMSQLEYLELESSELLDEMLFYIDGLTSTRVRHLRIVGCHSHIRGSDAWAHDALQCFNHLPTLQCLEIQKTSDEVYERWYRGVDRSVTIQWPLDADWVCDWDDGYRVVETLELVS